jgi:hypothetical protein
MAAQMVIVRVSLLLSVLALMLLPLSPVSASTTPESSYQFDEAKLQAYIEEAITSRWELIVNFQKEQLINNGQYYQVLPINSTVPEDGTKVLPDKLSVAPTYAPTKTAQAFYDAIKFDSSGEPFTVRVDVYDGPKAKGFVLCASYMATKIEKRRCWNFGQENYRADTAWLELKPITITK